MILKKFIDYALNFIYPPKCIFCGNLLSFFSEEHICDVCIKNLPFLDSKVCCERCGKQLVSFGKKKLCYNCINETHFYYKRIISVLEYNDDTRPSVLRYKDSPKSLYANVYSKLMYERFSKEYGNINFDYVITVPSDKIRTIKRGEDHAALLCEEFSKISGIPFYRNCLKKIRKTAKQARLSYEDRQTNLRNSMRAYAPEKIKNKTFLIIDDVCTTCASIKECSRELNFCGAKKVYALTLCTTSKTPEKAKS